MLWKGGFHDSRNMDDILTNIHMLHNKSAAELRCGVIFTVQFIPFKEWGAFRNKYLTNVHEAHVDVTMDSQQNLIWSLCCGNSPPCGYSIRFPAHGCILPLYNPCSTSLPVFHMLHILFVIWNLTREKKVTCSMMEALSARSMLHRAPGSRKDAIPFCRLSPCLVHEA